jgi:hypothetical protein
VIELDIGIIGAWASVWAAKDPFTLTTDDPPIAFTASLQAAIPAQQSSALDVRVDGHAKLTSRQEQGADVALLLECTVSMTDASANLGGTPRDPATRRPITVALVRRHTLQGDSLELRGPGVAPLFAALSWRGDPTMASLVVGRLGQVAGASLFDQPIQHVRYVTSVARADDDVATAGNPYHDAAVGGLKVVQTANADDPTFVDRAIAQLFPPTRSARGGIRPVKDWVLFRRRRREDCDTEVAVPPSTSTVAAWVAVADSLDDAEVLTRMLISGGGEKIEWRSFGPLTFEAGSARLTSDAAALRASYRAANGGPTAEFVAYAPNGVSAGGAARAQATIDALPPAAQLGPTGRVDIVDNPPVSRLVPGTEGSVFVVSWRPPAVETMCVDVRWIDRNKIGNPLQAAEILTALRTGKGDVLDRVPEFVIDLGEVRFPLNIPESQRVTQVARDIRQRYGDVIEIYGWFDDTLDAEGRDAAVDRLKRLIEAIGPEYGAPIDVRDIMPATFQDECRARLIALPQG